VVLSGLIDYTEFCEVLQVDPSPHCENVFQIFDYEKTGQIDAREVRPLRYFILLCRRSVSS
jgi:Ca2+-binding EF-hand superfamily protein